MDNLIGEVLAEAQLAEALDVAMLSPVVGDGLGLVEVDIRMTAQLLQRQPVDVQTLGVCVGNHKVFLGVFGKAVDFIQLVDADETSQSLTMTDNFAGIVGADARHFLELRRVGGIQYHLFVVLHFNGIAQGVAFLSRAFAHKCGSGLIILGNTDIWFQFAVLFHRQTIETGEILLLAIDASMCAILIDVAHLPGLQAQSQQLSAVGRIGIEGEAFCVLRFSRIILDRTLGVGGVLSTEDAIGSRLSGIGRVVAKLPKEHCGSYSQQQQRDSRPNVVAIHRRPNWWRKMNRMASGQMYLTRNR